MGKIKGYIGIVLVLHGIFLAYTVESKTIIAYRRDSNQPNVQENQTETAEVVSYGYTLTKTEICEDYGEIRDAYTSCQDAGFTEPLTVAFMLGALKAFCREKSLIHACIVGKFQNCANIDLIQSLLNTSFSFCDGEDIPVDLELLLVANYKAELPNDGCMDIVLERIYYGKCNYSTRPRRKWNGTLQDRASYYQRMYEWYIDCVLESDKKLDEYIPACSMTRRDAFAILVAGVQIFKGIGMNTYSLFEYFMSGGKEMSLFMADKEFYA